MCLMRAGWLVALLALLTTPGLAATLSTPPGLDREGLDAWQKYQKATKHRAFAIAPGGAWGWQDGLPSALSAQQMALSACQQQGDNPCQLFDLNGAPRMDAAAWAASLSTRYATAVNAPVGIEPGQRFPNLILAERGTPDLAALQGKAQGRLVVLHFWGAWCPPCAAEIPDFARTTRKLRADDTIRVLAIPAFEPAQDTRNWLRARHIDLRITAPQSHDGQTLLIRAPNGQRIETPARALAPVFPSTFVLDGNGVVLMRQLGPIPDWAALLPILRHAARHTLKAR